MLIQNDDFLRTFKKVKAVQEHMGLYHVGEGSHTLSVDTLCSSVADMYELKIEMYEVAASVLRVDGMMERYADGRAVILVRADLGDDQKRFVAVKELCHLMVDEEDDWSTTGVETIRLMKVEFDLADNGEGGVMDPCRQQVSEYLAWTAALALMYPCEFHEADMAKVASGENTLTKIGLFHGIPALQIENAFNHPHVFELYAEA
jgi:hypothetical protein